MQQCDWCEQHTTLHANIVIFKKETLPLSRRDSTVSKVYYEVHMTRIPYTARIDNIDSIMFVDRNVSFEIGKELRKKINFFLNLHAGSA